MSENGEKWSERLSKCLYLVDHYNINTNKANKHI